MGDCSFYRIVADLSNVRHPLVQVSWVPVVSGSSNTKDPAAPGIHST